MVARVAQVVVAPMVVQIRLVVQQHLQHKATLAVEVRFLILAVAAAVLVL
jgi:hypothetical protein